MTSNKFRAVLLGCAAVALLGACTGADGVASPGVGAFVPPPAPPPAPPAPPPPGPPAPPTGGPAADCPAGFANVGTISNRRICQLPQTITGALVVPEREGTIYSVSGQTRVGIDLGPDATSPLPGGAQGILTIEPGVTIFGSAGLDYLLVNRGSLIFAEGTPEKPIIMTSRQSVAGTTNENSIGQWGGLVINGRAPTRDGCPAGVTSLPNIACEAQVEGSNAFYGGISPADNSGRIQYLRVMYSGFEIAPNNELNGITLAGVGHGTTFEYVQVHNSSDDGIEIFGGNVNLKYIVITGSDDDQFDTDSGWRGAAQFGIAYQRTAGGDYGFETSNRPSTTTNNLLATRPVYANWTIVQRTTLTAAGQRRAGIVHNTGHVGQVFNSVVTANNGVQCLQVANADTLNNPNNFGGNGPVFRSVFMSCDGGAVLGSGGVTNAQVDSILDVAGSNNVKAGTSTLINGFINGANENAVPATNILALPQSASPNALPASIASYLTPVDYIGAVRDANDTWYQGWTCGLPTTPAC
ncbi:hypothetical protein [Hyphomonas sp.]|uniref:hypothetical protein n=1 Tax=Hyphomonas sp. TaxID=87 RepID=UPI003919EE36